ncbi:heat shock factor protein 1 [Nephila pilipes]|uniref:Heat shock factor protein 1 n=1 Tax=Nephila pilipes TaxID=299642 RepID=A0A8X6UM19_NEPPI|nr:heat shock factor protein 1 [Nephila pilipes]
MNYEKTGLRNENSEMEFQHGFFIKERGELLELIKRKVPEPPVKSNAKDILFDLTSIREKQENMDSMLLKMKQENELLWRELTSMRQKHKAQEQIIQKVIQFLVSIVQRSGNQNLGVGRKITRMLHDSPSSKPNSSQVARTIDVLRNKNSECIIVPEQMVSPLGPVIHEVTDCDHEDVNNSPSISVVKSPSVIQVVDSPADKEARSITKAKSPIVSTLNCSSNLTVPMEPLGILEALQNRTQAVDKDESDKSESILGIPLEYITDQGNTEVANVISIPEDDNIGNVISIPESSIINDIIPISKFSNVISIPENAAVNNKASNIDDNPSYNVLTGSEFLPDIAAFSELQPSTSNESSQNLSLALSRNDFVDSLLSESLQTPKIITSNEEIYCPDETKKKDELVKSDGTEKASSSNNNAHNEHNYQLATTDSSTNLVKNVLSNHLLSVDETLNYTQDQLASNTWNIDVQNLLGVCGLWNSWTSLDPQLFSTDELINYDALPSSLNEDVGIKNEANDIIGNEIVQFTPNLLDVEMEIANNPLFETLNQDAEVPSTGFDYQSEPLLDILKETSTSTNPDLSNQSTINDLSTKRKKPTKSSKTKRRKAK